MSDTVLYDYWRSSASFRLRIALNMAAETFRTVPVDILAKEHRSEAHLARNPQGLVPVLEIDGHRFTQSLSVIEYLDETRGGAFLPGDSVGRQRVRALSYVIAMEIHPVCNTHVTAHVVSITGGGDEARVAWMQKFIGEGLAAFEVLLNSPRPGRFAMATCRAWRISASCRRSTMRGDGASISQPAPGLSPSPTDAPS